MTKTRNKYIAISKCCHLHQIRVFRRSWSLLKGTLRWFGFWVFKGNKDFRFIWSFCNVMLVGGQLPVNRGNERHQDLQSRALKIAQITQKWRDKSFCCMRIPQSNPRGLRTRRRAGITSTTTAAATPCAVNAASTARIAILANFHVRMTNGNQEYPKVYIISNCIARPLNNFPAANCSCWTNLKVISMLFSYYT